MATSPLKIIKERIRQHEAQDNHFYKKMLFFFELRVPADQAWPFLNPFVFPLVLNPESYSMEEPFSVEATPTQGGGLYVEENGIVQRTIKLEGTTGFKPRGLRKRQPAALAALKPEQKSFGRELPALVFNPISGQRHFQYLQDAVFRTYADLKRDPATAADTSMIFHNTKDQEQWLVAPQRFTLTRSAEKRVLYQYSIELLILDKADSLVRDWSEDKSLLDTLKDKIRMIKSGLDMITGALNDLTAIANEIKTMVKNVLSIIDNVTAIIRAVGDFIDGVTDLIELPYTFLESVNSLIDEALSIRESLEEAGTAIKALPATTKQKFRVIQDGLYRIGTHPEAFESTSHAKMRKLRERQEALTGTSRDAINAALDTSPPSTLSGVRNLGTAVTQGDVISARGELGVGQRVYNYTGSRPITVAQGDTLANLAATYLGDARLWQHIAVINGLKPPFLVEHASTPLFSDSPSMPGTLNIGDTILIPNFGKPPQKQPLLPVLGVTMNEPVEVHLLGTDFREDPVYGAPGAQQYDWVIDVEGGSQDIARRSGLANLAQGVRTRLITERGTDTLFKRLGPERVVGLNNADVDLETARFRIVEAIVQDPRISAVRRMEFPESSSPDVLETDADVEVRGLTQTASIVAPIILRS